MCLLRPLFVCMRFGRYSQASPLLSGVHGFVALVSCLCVGLLVVFDSARCEVFSYFALNLLGQVH